MANEKVHNKKKKEQKKVERLICLLNVDLCACGGGNQLRCHGMCKKSRINPNTGKVECKELYQIDHSVVKQSGPRRPKRTWRYGRQKEENENKHSKQQRREKRERDQS